MKILFVKLILLFAFALLVLHNVIPHMHFDEHTEIHHNNKQTECDEQHDEPVFSHYFDDIFISKKPLDLSSKLILVSFVSIPILEIKKTNNFLIDQQESIPAAPVISSISLRAPPLS